MPLRVSIGIGSLGEEKLILLTGLKESLKPKRERILKILKDLTLSSPNYEKLSEKGNSII